MPELPEVETIRRALEPLLLGRVVERATLHRRDVLITPADPSGGFSRQRTTARRAPTRVEPIDLLRGCTITALTRRGKQLAILTADQHNGRALIVQLGMSGQLLAFAPREPIPALTHVHAEWHIAGGARLLFRDPRRFGGLRALPTTAALHDHWRPLGPDALTISAAELHAALAHTRRPLKAALLDQSLLAGVGNIYADEALHLAGLHPARRADTLDKPTAANLAEAIRTVLTDAVARGGSTLRDYITPTGEPGGYQSEHRVYGRAGKPCSTCGCTLESTTLAQRTTTWCPACQPRRAKPNSRGFPHSGQAQSSSRPRSPRASFSLSR